MTLFGLPSTARHVPTQPASHLGRFQQSASSRDTRTQQLRTVSFGPGRRLARSIEAASSASIKPTKDNKTRGQRAIRQCPTSKHPSASLVRNRESKRAPLDRLLHPLGIRGSRRREEVRAPQSFANPRPPLLSSPNLISIPFSAVAGGAGLLVAVGGFARCWSSSSLHRRRRDGFLRDE